MARLQWLAGLLLAVMAAAGNPPASDVAVLFGEDKKEVLACRCSGPKAPNGHCGYHLHFGSNEDQPWCRTLHGCGTSSMLKGSWNFCDERAVERRRANDGKLYHAKDFQKFYGKGKDGAEKWTGAKPFIERRLAKNGKPYTVGNFREYYLDAYGELGWVEKWEQASEEQRKADDGKDYSWDDFAKYYGDDKAWSKWEGAGPLKEEL